MEYPWESQHLVSPPAKVLDVGCGYSSIIPLEKGLETYAIDINEAWIPKVEGLKGSVQDIRRTDFPDGFFDQVIFLSTLEHVGMDWYYNKWIDFARGDFDAMRETNRILKSGGSVLVTVPYGPEYVEYQALRVYDSNRVRQLLECFKLTSIDYYILQNGHWRSATHEEASRVGCPRGDIMTIICFEAVKAKTR